MAYTDATAADLTAAFPAFAAVAEETITFWLGRAPVDETWTETDYGMAQMLYAAHEMTLNGLGAGAEAEMAANGASGFKTIRSGSLTLERFDGGSAGSSGSGAGYSATSYGQRFLQLLRRNKAGPRVMATGAAPYDPRRYPHGQA